MRIVSVDLGSRSYPIVIEPGVLKTLGARCAEMKLGKRCAVITDDRVGPLYAERCLKSLKRAGFDPILFTIPAGEKSKDLRSIAKAYDTLAKHRLERKSFVVALGGGVVGDLAGFVSSTYLRGVPFVQVPTTLLAQVDSSVGGKVGVNLKAGKNLVGAFHQPKLVLCDLQCLKSLPQREFISGIAEIIKYGIIYDSTFFDYLEKNMAGLLKKRMDVLTHVVARCCEIKAEVVSQDETESGLRAILNFGHTIGHAIEAIFRYGKYLHGEAISIGQVAAASLSVQNASLEPSEKQRIQRLFLEAGLPTQIKLTSTQQTRLMSAMRLDKKVASGQVKFVLAERIGSVTWGNAVNDNLILREVGG